MHGNAIEVVAVLLKDVELGAFLRDCVYRQHDFIGPFLDRHPQLQPLPRSITPADEAMSVLRCRQTFDLVRQSDIEPQRAGIRIDFVGQANDLQTFQSQVHVAWLFDDSRDRPLPRCSRSDRTGVLLKGQPFDGEVAVIGQDTQRFARRHRLPLVDMQIGNHQRGRGFRLLRRISVGRRLPHHRAD